MGEDRLYNELVRIRRVGLDIYMEAYNLLYFPGVIVDLYYYVIFSDAI